MMTGHIARLFPALPDVTAEGPTRAAALESAAEIAGGALGEILAAGGETPREDWPPVRTVWVRNPRRGDASPYIVMIQREDEGQYRATPVAFPDVSVVSSDLEDAVGQVGPLLFQRLTEMFAQGRHYSTQDDPQNYVIRVTARDPVQTDA